MKRYRLALSLILASLSVHAETDSCEQKSGWTMIYQNDFQGFRVAGDISSLVKAIKNGADVKASYESNDLTVMFNCEWTTAKDGYASCINTHAVSGNYYEPDNELGKTQGAFKSMMMVNTEGEWDLSRWSVNNYQNRKHIKKWYMISWWVRTP